MSSSARRRTKLCLPKLLADSKESSVRSDMTWLVAPGARFKKGQPLGYMRAFHTDIGCQWEFMSNSEVQVIVSARAGGEMVTNHEGQGGWYSLAPLLPWNENLELGAVVRFGGTSDVADMTEVDCTILRAERYHPYLETRGGGILTSPFSRSDLWSGAPEPAALKLIDIGLCDHAAVFGETGGAYHDWTGLLRSPSVITRPSDTVHAFSSYAILRDLTATRAERAAHAEEVGDLLKAYLDRSDREQTFHVTGFLSLLIGDLESPILSKELDRPAIRAAHAPAPEHKVFLLSASVENAVHLRSRTTGFTFSILSHRLRAFDKAFQQLLAERFEWVRTNREDTLENCEKIISILREHGYKTIISNMILPPTRSYDYSLLGDLRKVPDYWLRETNNALRKLTESLGEGYLDTNAVMSQHGSKGLIDTVHHNRAVLDLTRHALVRTMKTMGLPEDLFEPAKGFSP